MTKSLFEELGGKYERQGDYLIPCLTRPAEEEQPIGTGHNGTFKGKKRLRMGTENPKVLIFCEIQTSKKSKLLLITSMNTVF